MRAEAPRNASPRRRGAAPTGLAKTRGASGRPGALWLPFLVLAGCPGTLDHKERFLVDGMFVRGDASMAGEDPGDAGNADAGGLDAGGSDGGPCGDVPARIFVPSCGGAGCHGKTAPQQSLDLESAGVAARVIGVAAKECVGTLADRANPDASLLYKKLLPSPPCGAQMPLARPPLSAADVACVRAWIAAP